MFKPKIIFYEKEVEKYKLGKELLSRYQKLGVKCIEIENHNSIKEMQTQPNSEFKNMKQNLIIGTRKTHRFVENHKVSDYLVPYTSSGCIAMCLYCYLICHFNKCAYLRIFVNREEMLEKIIKVSNKSEKELTFEIGSNSDLILENTITNNLPWTINNFIKNSKKGNLTFPTKFDMVDELLGLNHDGRIIVRMSVNPKEIISKIEIGTSPLKNRVIAINKLVKANYKVGILIAPIILVDGWQKLYEELIEYLYNNLSEKAKSEVFFEVIFMTYSYIHRMINKEAFINIIDLYNDEKMKSRGIGKYAYKKEVKEDAESVIKQLLKKYFSKNEIKYIV